MCAAFELDSEYERLALIQTPLSYKLNPTTLEIFALKSPMVAEVIEMSKQLRKVEETGGVDDLLLIVADETLKQVFREKGAKVIYDYLENNAHLKPEEIAEKPEVFSAGLERLMVSAAQMIEKLILENLYGKLGLRFREKEGYEFSDYIKELREECGC